MGLVTLEQLRKRVRELADLEDDLEFVDDAEITGHINRSLWALDDLLHKTWADYFALEQPTTFGGASYPLPEDFYKLVALDVRRTDSTWTDLKPYMLAERNALRNLTTPVTVDVVKYRILGRSLKFLPEMPAGTQAILTYYPQYAALVSETDTREYDNGWEEWACLRTAIVLLAKEERDTSALEKLWALEEARINASAPVRDEAPATFVEAADVGDLTADGVARWRR